MNWVIVGLVVLIGLAVRKKAKPEGSGDRVIDTAADADQPVTEVDSDPITDREEWGTATLGNTVEVNGVVYQELPPGSGNWVPVKTGRGG